MNQFLRFGKSVTIIIAHNNLKIGDMAVYYKVFLKTVKHRSQTCCRRDRLMSSFPEARCYNVTQSRNFPEERGGYYAGLCGVGVRVHRQAGNRQFSYLSKRVYGIAETEHSKFQFRRRCSIPLQSIQERERQSSIWMV